MNSLKMVDHLMAVQAEIRAQEALMDPRVRAVSKRLYPLMDRLRDELHAAIKRDGEARVEL